MVNIAEILKDAPKGLKLYSLVHGEVKLKDVWIEQEYYPIEIITDKQGFNNDSFTKDGKIFYDFTDTECMLYPSKEHKSWDEWQDVLFQKGDVIVSIDKVPVLYYEDKGSEYSVYNKYGVKLGKTLTYLFNSRYATPEEREQFMTELNANGYKWNDDTKQIEKIKQQYTPKYDCFGCVNTRIKEKQFTIDDLKPFDKVLVRNYDVNTWSMEFFESYKFNHYYCMTDHYNQCIPYNDETSKLLGTKNDCPKKYKTW